MTLRETKKGFLESEKFDETEKQPDGRNVSFERKLLRYEFLGPNIMSYHTFALVMTKIDIQR
jgi:hypothetical protein